MNTTTDSIDLTIFDARTIPCRIKHGMIFKRWHDLAVGAHFVLINDHDPVPLYYQFAAQFPNAFTWEYLVAGPEEFQVKITRTAATDAPPAVVAPPHPTPAASAAPAADGGCGTLVDARGLQPPEPMVRILTAVENAAPGATLHALTDRRPIHLYGELDQRNVAYQSTEQTDGSWVTRLTRR